MGTEKMCTFLCTADDGCPTGFACRAVASGTTITSYQCVPTNGTCKVAPPPPAAAVLVLNEVYASPKEDANGDGTLSTKDDEFVEIVNAGGTEMDVSGWSVSDSAMLRLKFPAGTKVAAGKALVVFAGGDKAKFGSLGGATILVSSKNALGLNNTGDTVTLKDAKGKVVDQVKFGSEGGKGVSIARVKDGDPASAWAPHPDVAQSAGLRTDGTPF
jgi:hypothetical protein